MKKVVVLVMAAVVVAALCGCDLLRVQSMDANVNATMRLVSVDAGWVEVEVSGAVGGFRIHWGDSYEPDSYSDVAFPGTYAHWYPRAGRYAAVLLNGQDVVATAVVPVEVVQHHLELISQGGQIITVDYYGFKDQWYEIHWGAMDIHGTPGPQVGYDDARIVVANGSTVGTEISHQYYQGGTFDVTMRPLGALPETARKFFTVVVPGGE